MAWAAAAMAWSLARLALAATGGYEVSLRAEARAAAGGGATRELQLEPAAKLTLRSGRFDVASSYSPNLVLEGARLDRLATLHRVALEGGWSGPRALQLRARAQASYGTNRFLSLQPPTAADAAPPPTQPVPRVATLGYMSLDVALQASLRPAPRHSARLEVGAFTSGGTDAEARAVLPLQRGGRIALGHGWTVAAHDQLDTDLAGTVTDFERGLLSSTATATVTWRHLLPLEGRVWGTLGLAGSSTGRRPDETWRGDLGFAAAAGAFLPIQGRSLAGGAVASISPFTDRLSGAVYQRADLSALLHARPSRRWSVSTTVSGGLPVWASQGDAVVTAEVRATWAGARWVDLAGGARALWQRPIRGDPAQPAAQVREVGLFLSAHLRQGERI